MNAVTQMFYARRGEITGAMRRVAEREGLETRAGQKRGRAGPPDHPRQRPPPRGPPRPDGDRHGRRREDQRQHRELGGDVGRGRRAGEAALRGALRCRHGDGPLDRGRHRRDPRGDHRRQPRPHRHGPHLPGSSERRGRRGHHAADAPRQHRASGAPGRGLHHGALRHPARAHQPGDGAGHRHREPRRLAARGVDGAAPGAEPALHALRRTARDRPRARRLALARRRPPAGLASPTPPTRRSSPSFASWAS